MCIVSGDVVESTCYAWRVRLVIATIRWPLCLNCANFPCLRVKVHKIWSTMLTKMLNRHVPAGFKPGTERTGVIL